MAEVNGVDLRHNQRHGKWMTKLARKVVVKKAMR
jgi:hypothetical protein